MTQQDHTRKIIGHYERRLQKLKERKAQLGLGTPPEILVEIEDTEAEIRKIKAGWVDVLSTQIEKLATELEKSKSRAATVLLENQSLKDYIAKLEKENQVLKNHVAELEAAPIPNANRKILPASYLDSRPDTDIQEKFEKLEKKCKRLLINLILKSKDVPQVPPESHLQQMPLLELIGVLSLCDPNTGGDIQILVVQITLRKGLLPEANDLEWKKLNTLRDLQKWEQQLDKMGANNPL